MGIFVGGGGSVTDPISFGSGVTAVGLGTTLGTGSKPGLVLGSDANWYRVSSSTMKTDVDLQVGGSVKTFGGGPTGTGAIIFGSGVDLTVYRRAAGVLVLGDSSITAPTGQTGHVFMLKNCTVEPTVGGGGPTLYAFGGALKCIGTSNTVTTLAVA